MTVGAAVSKTLIGGAIANDLTRAVSGGATNDWISHGHFGAILVIEGRGQIMTMPKTQESLRMIA